MHFGRIFSLLSKDVYHFSDGALRTVGPFRYLHDGLVAGFSALEFVFRNENIVGKGTALRDEEAKSLFHLQLPNEGVFGTLQDFRHLGLTRVSWPACQHRDLHAVSIEGVERIALTNQDTLSTIVGQEGVSAIALALESTLHHVGAHGISVVSFIVRREVIVEHQF